MYKYLHECYQYFYCDSINFCFNFRNWQGPSPSKHC